MTVIELPDDQAAAEGLGLEAWLGRLAADEQKNKKTPQHKVREIRAESGCAV
jgi:hypothetical protein